MTLDTGETRRDAPSPARRWSWVRRLVRVGWFLLLAVALVLALRSRWSEVSDQVASLEPWRLAAALVVGFIGVGLSAGIWHTMLLGIGERLSLRASLRIFFVGQIGKYLPGAVWPAVTQAALARDHGVAPRATVAAVTLFLWVHIVSGAAIGLAVLATAGRLPLLTLLAVPPLLALLTPAVLRWALQHLLRLARREPLRRLPDGGHMAIAVGWAALMWICYGLHLLLLTAAVGSPVGLARVTGVFALAWVIGFVLLVAPAGVGPREAAVVALLPLTAAGALLVALMSRLVLTAADAAWAAVTGVAPREPAQGVDAAGNDQRVDESQATGRRPV